MTILKIMTMFNIKNFRLSGIFTCPRCGTPCYSNCCGTTTTSAFESPIPKEPVKKRLTKRKRKSDPESINATMADSGDKTESKNVNNTSTPSDDASPPAQETITGFSVAKEAIELSYRAGAQMFTGVTVATPQADLAHFLSRPVVIHRQAWDPASPFTAHKINPWNLLLGQNAAVLDKLRLYKLMACTLKIRITVNGSPFHYGRVFVGVLPDALSNNTTNLSPDDNVTVVNYHHNGAAATWQANRCFYSQRPHVFVNPNSNATNIITWPFFHQAPFTGLFDSATNFATMGYLEIWEMNALKMSNGNTDPAMISFFAWVEDVRLVGIDATMADEYVGNGIISRPATSLARFAARFAGTSQIGRLARATELGANAVGSIASLFGFANPAIIDKETVVARVQAGRMPNVIGYSPVVKLSLDPKQELSIDPTLMNLPSRDEMSFDYLTKIEALIHQITIATTDTGHVFGVTVNPTLGPLIDAASSVELTVNGKNLTPVGMVSMPFKMWRGSLVFRLQFVCSQMHRGRFIVTYTPTSNSSVGHATNLPELNQYFSHIVDLSEDTDVSFEIKWNQAVSWHQVEHFYANSTYVDVCSGTGLTLTRPSTQCNGRLDIHVLNQVVAPDTDAFIGLNVYMRAGDDFQVANPDNEYMGYSFSTAGGLYPLPDATMSDINATMSDASFLRASEEDLTNQKTAVILNDNFVETDVETLYGSYAGEQVLSVRSLIKRFAPHNSYFQGAAPSSRYLTLSIAQPNFPIGRSLLAYGSSGVDQQGVRSNCWMTHIRWFGQSYVGFRGGVRWGWGTFNSQGHCLFNVSRGNTFDEYRIHKSSNSGAVGLTDAEIEHAMQGDNTPIQYGSNAVGSAGIQVYTNDDSGYFSYEIPFYSPMRYVSIQRGGTSSWGYQRMAASHVVVVDIPTNNTAPLGYAPTIGMRSYVAAAEDFSFHFFIGFPIIYEQAPQT